MIDFLWKVFVALGLIVGSIVFLSIIFFIIQCGIDAAREVEGGDY